MTSKYIISHKSLVLYRITWNHITVYKLFVQTIVTWNYNCLFIIIIIIIIIIIS